MHKYIIAYVVRGEGVPKTTFSFSDSLRRFTELRKAILVVKVYYSKEKSFIEQSPGESGISF